MLLKVIMIRLQLLCYILAALKSYICIYAYI